jgi:hypothetical protein
MCITIGLSPILAVYTRSCVNVCRKLRVYMCGGGGGEKGQIRCNNNNNNNNNNNTERGVAIRLFDRLFTTFVDTSLRKKNLLDVDRFFPRFFFNDQNFFIRHDRVTAIVRCSPIYYVYCIYYYSCFPVQVAFVDGTLDIHIILIADNTVFAFD